MTDPAVPLPAGADAVPVEVAGLELALPLEVRSHPRFERPLETSTRQATLLTAAPWIRPLGKLEPDVTTQGWRFPTPPDQPPRQQPQPPRAPRPAAPAGRAPEIAYPEDRPGRTRIRPPADAVLFKDRLLYLLQPPLED